MGSACLFFAIQPQKALLSDINAELVETFTVVRDHPRALYNRLIRIRKGKRNYYKLRDMNPAEMGSLDRAARFIFLNRYCFNGLYRTNQAGEFNVPFSASRPGRLPTWEELWGASHALKNAELRESDFGKVLTTVRKGDLVYLDPPYAVENRTIFRQYGPQTFGLDDIERLRDSLVEIDKRGAHFVLSYAFCREAKEAFDKWNMRKIFTQRNISGFAKHRRRAAELIISNIVMSS